MLYLACIITTACCGFLVARLLPELRQRAGELAFFASYGLIFGVAPMMQSEHSYAQDFGQEARVLAAWYGLAGLAVLIAGFEFMRRSSRSLAAERDRLLKQIDSPRGQRFLERVFWGSIAVTVGAQMLMMHAKGISLTDILHAGRFTYRFNNSGVLTVLSTHLTSFVYVPAFVGVFLSRRYLYLTLAYLPIASCIFFFVFSKGTRSIPLAMITTALIAASIRYRVSPRRFGYACVGGTVALMLAIGLYELRQHQDSISTFDCVRILLSSETYSGMWDRDPLGYGVNLVGAISSFPDHHPFLDGATYKRMLVFYLQESKYPDLKPPDSNVLFGLVVHGRNEELQVTSPPSLLGDIYINFHGWWGLPVLFLHGALYCWMLQKMQVSLWALLWIGPLSGRFLVLVHRGEPYEMFVLFVMFFLTMMAMRRACRIGLDTEPANNRKPHRPPVRNRVPRPLSA